LKFVDLFPSLLQSSRVKKNAKNNIPLIATGLGFSEHNI